VSISINYKGLGLIENKNVQKFNGKKNLGGGRLKK